MFPCTPAVMQEEHAVCVVFLNCRIFLGKIAYLWKVLFCGAVPDILL
jgi:hypothetical protein